MKITLEPTGRFDTVEGVRCRIWTGMTESGAKLTAYIPFVKVHRDEDNTEFEKALSEVKVVRELVSFDYRMVL
jgi:hypothetical protein